MIGDYQTQKISDFKEKLRNRYLEICPPLYRNTNGEFKGVNQDSLKKVQLFDPKSNKGLMVIGDTGTGKTTSVWMLIKRLLCEDGVPVLAIRDPEFSREYSMRLGNGTADEWIDKLCRVRVLFIDDLGKSATTPRYKEQLHDVIDSRINNLKPTIITTQYNRARLIDRFGDEDGRGIVRRVLEFCEIISF